MASIRARGKNRRIYVRFRYMKVEMHEPTKYFCARAGEKECKCLGCISARRLARQIQNKIDNNTFELYDYFPNSKAIDRIIIFGDVKSMDFPTYAKRWLELKKPVIAPSTYRSYKQVVNKLIGHLQTDMKLIKPGNIRELIKIMHDRNISPKTIKNNIYVASNIFAQALEDKLIFANPVNNVKMPKTTRPTGIEPFSALEIQAILSDIKKHNPQYVAYFAIGFYTGMRTGEILALTWDDVDLDYHTIHVNKTMTNRTLKLSTKTNNPHKVDIVSELDEYLLDHKAYSNKAQLFRMPNGKPISDYRLMTDVWRKSLTRLMLKQCNPYKMRHSFACLALSLNIDPNWIKDMMGYVDLTMLFTTYGRWHRPIKLGRMSLKKN